MIYLEDFTLPDEDREWNFFRFLKSRASSDYYPFQIFPNKEINHFEFEPVTIIYGDNGSGKSTLLNIIAEKLRLQRGTLYNRARFFDDYLGMCSYTAHKLLPENSSMITSDEIFNYMLNLRALNQGIDNRREEIFEDYLDHKYGDFKFRSLDDYDELKKTIEMRRKTQSRYAREHLQKNVTERSNGESAMHFFAERIKENQLYLLDEPENSLSPAKQQELVKFLNDSARFFNCQFIIATHSPFLLSLDYAKIYDLDSTPVTIKKWYELPEVKVYADFFEKNRNKFKKNDGDYE
ncbi:AAA family ATPase [Companilactobacillus mishanensis]|uniref:ATP-binding cassette domain-containing protein n=1 Tax=Companilactobacillus mishanensis TaxID=2486008 RepID=A0A5P0ZG00_9LACO|nr:AAA family ATPase [Companilactobacillus mishanensis]MQS51981.1 ATP-binding cassette domain-containing protein [Companilactobacillus mishanensis]